MTRRSLWHRFWDTLYNIYVRHLAHKSDDHRVWVQHLEAYMLWQHFTCMSLGTQWMFPDTEPAYTRQHSGIHLECVKETSLYRILCECTTAYSGETGCSIETGTTDSSALNKSAITEHSINILLKDKGVRVLARKYSHINYITWDMRVNKLRCEEMVTA